MAQCSAPSQPLHLLLGTHRYTTFGGVIRSGKGIITKLARREQTDRLLIIVGVMFFVLTVRFEARHAAFSTSTFSWRAPRFVFRFCIFFFLLGAVHRAQEARPVGALLWPVRWVARAN